MPGPIGGSGGFIDLSAYAKDAETVHNDGPESIDGTKNFLTTPTLPTSGTPLSSLDFSGTSLSQTAQVDLPLGTSSVVAMTGILTTVTFLNSPSAKLPPTTLRLIVSGGPYTLTIPTSYRLGQVGSITSVTVPNGSHELSWIYASGRQWLVDSLMLTPLSVGVACSDETTSLTTGTAKATFRMPRAMTLIEVRATLTTAQVSGTIFTVDINEAGTTILSTKLTIDNTEKTSTTAATLPVISDANIADDAEITVDIDQIGNSTAKGLKVWLIGV